MIQGSEFFIILLVALVVMGPQRLPEMARKVGQWTAELRRTAADLRAGLEAEVSDFQEISKELKAPLGDITAVARDTTDAANRVIKPVNPGGPTVQRTSQAAEQPDDAAPGEALAWTGPQPRSGPTPEDAMADLEEIERSGEPIVGEAGEVEPGEPRVDPSTADPKHDPVAPVEEGQPADDPVPAEERRGAPSTEPPHEALG